MYQTENTGLLAQLQMNLNNFFTFKDDNEEIMYRRFPSSSQSHVGITFFLSFIIPLNTSQQFYAEGAHSPLPLPSLMAYDPHPSQEIDCSLPCFKLQVKVV